MEREARSLSLKGLTKSIFTQEFKIPSYQRDFVWKHKDHTALLDSVLRNMPIGSMIFWKISGSKVKSKTFANIIPTEARDIETYVLDGQQRLTSLYTMRFGIGDAKNLCINLDCLKSFYKGNPVLEKQLFYFGQPCSKSMRFSDIFDDEKIDDAWHKYANRFANEFNSYEISISEIECTPHEAQFIFERVNTAGKQLTLLESISPKYSQNLDLYGFFESIDKAIGEDFAKTYSKRHCDPLKILIPKSAVINAPNIRKISPILVEKQMRNIITAYKNAATFMTSMGITKKNNKLRNNQLFHGVAYFYFLNCNDHLKDGQKEALEMMINHFQSIDNQRSTNTFLREVYTAAEGIYNM